MSIRQKPDGTTFYTDQGNIILDSNFGAISDPSGLAEELKSRTGIVEHGLFIRLVSDVIVAAASGTRQLQKQP